MGRKGDGEDNDYTKKKKKKKNKDKRLLPPVQPSGNTCIASFFKLPDILLLF